MYGEWLSRIRSFIGITPELGDVFLRRFNDKRGVPDIPPQGSTGVFERMDLTVQAIEVLQDRLDRMMDRFVDHPGAL